MPKRTSFSRKYHEIKCSINSKAKEMCISFKFVAANLKKNVKINFLNLFFFFIQIEKNNRQIMCLIKKITYTIIRKINIDISYFILLIIELSYFQ